MSTNASPSANHSPARGFRRERDAAVQAVGGQLSAVSCQRSVVSGQLSAVSCQRSVVRFSA
ncbi:MAG: hypothetical protein BRD44_01140 [Bacteroidetes bacterium QS_7_67_15]|nr:MAG: hypothetical protein BRD44_01140 [Bacteroidetes bacterium QS_7_67_15]